MKEKLWTDVKNNAGKDKLIKEIREPKEMSVLKSIVEGTLKWKTNIGKLWGDYLDQISEKWWVKSMQVKEKENCLLQICSKALNLSIRKSNSLWDG